MSNALLKYSFYDTKSQTIIENLSWSQAHSFCRYVYKNGYESFYIHPSNEARWTPLEIHIEDLLKVTKDLLRTIPVPTNELDDKTVVMNHQLIDSPVDRRQHQRYPKKIDVTIDIGGLLKKAQTEDISLSGMKLDKDLEVPTTVKFAMVYVKYNNILIEFKVKLIIHEKRFNTFSLISCNNLPSWKSIVENT